jgi:hypothetical protein
MPGLETLNSELGTALLRITPPWLIISALGGIISAAAFFVIAGRGLRSLPTYLLLGLAAAPICQAFGAGLPIYPSVLAIGEVHLGVIALGTWGLLAIARALKL